MSYATWARKYYKIPANKVPAEKAVDHCIRKWTGLSKRNLREHGLTYKIEDQEFTETTEIVTKRDNKKVVFEVTNRTCALCQVHYSDDLPIDSCENCPLYRVRGNVSCTELMDGENYSPYDIYCESGNVKPMLEWLKLAKKFEELNK